MLVFQSKDLIFFVLKKTKCYKITDENEQEYSNSTSTEFLQYDEGKNTTVIVKTTEHECTNNV